MDPHQQAFVFDDRCRSQWAAANATVPGTSPVPHSPRRSHGLGLGIVRRLSHLMGADVRLRSQPGKGTVFEIAFRDPGGEVASGGVQLG
ncbi:MAG: sensor histidine kinase [Limnohabitans sp.]|nr:sensor histidine kinase [Limnohabitans sp.]